MPADDQSPNRAELEYTARVDELSFRASREQVRREVEATVQQARQGAAATPSGDPELEEIRRVRAERDRERQERNAARIADTNAQRVISDEEFRIMARLNAARNRADQQEISGKRRVRDEAVKLAQEKAKAEELALRSGASQNLLYPGIGPANFSLTGGYRSSQLARAGTEELEAFRAAQTGGGGGGRGGIFGGGGYNRFAQRRVIAEAGYLVGAPEVGQVASLAAYGPQFAVVGAALAVIAVGLESIKQAAKDQSALITFSSNIITLGGDFSKAKADADSFRQTLQGTREDAAKLSEAFAKLQLTGIAKPQDIEQIKTIALARGESTDRVAQVLEGLGKGSKEVFESETGIKYEEAVARAAIAHQTEIKYLTESQKIQELYNEYKQQSIQLEDNAAARIKSTSYEYEQLKKNIGDFLSTTGTGLLAFLEKLKSGQVVPGPLRDIATRFSALGGITPGQGLTNLVKTGEYFSPVTMATEYLSNLGYARQQEEESRLSNIAALAKNKPGATQTGAAAGVDITAIADQITNANKKLSDEYDRFSGSAAEKTKLLLSNYERFKDSLIGTPAEVTKLTAGIADEYEKKLKPLFEDAEKKVVSFSKTFRDQFTEFAQLQLGEKENPYVKLFSEGELAAARAREQFALAGDAVVNQIIKAQKAMQQTEVYELRIKDTLSAVKLEFQAAELSKPFFELTKEMKNTISVFQLELKSALTGPEYLFQARQIETGGYATFQNVSGGALQGLRGGQLEELRRLRARYAGSPGLGGDEVNHLLDQEYIKLYQQLSPGERQQVFQFGGARFDFSNAYRGEAGYNRRQIELQIQRNQAGLANVRLAQQQLGELARISPGQNRDLTRRAFLDITGTLSREELTPDLIKGRAVALQEEARFTREREDRARKAIEQTEKFQNAVIGQLQNLLGAVQGRNEKVLVEVLDRTDTAKIHTLGQSFER